MRQKSTAYMVHGKMKIISIDSMEWGGIINSWSMGILWDVTFEFWAFRWKAIKIRNTDNTRCWQGCSKEELSFTAGGKAKSIDILEDSLQFLQNPNILLPHNPAIVLFSITQINCTYIHIHLNENCTLEWLYGRFSLIQFSHSVVWFFATPLITAR